MIKEQFVIFINGCRVNRAQLHSACASEHVHTQSVFPFPVSKFSGCGAQGRWKMTDCLQMKGIARFYSWFCDENYECGQVKTMNSSRSFSPCYNSWVHLFFFRCKACTWQAIWGLTTHVTTTVWLSKSTNMWFAELRDQSHPQEHG